MVLIRRVCAEDIVTVVRLASENLPERYNPAIFNHFYEQFPQGFLVAEDQGSLVGFLIGVKTSHTTARILMLAVVSSQRRKKIGSLLLHHFIETMELYQINIIELEVRTSNTQAIGFYTKHGFIIQDTLKNFYQNHEDAYLMILPLRINHH
ncbi:MAG: ribosomal protein S18-alanine N-acetyltransferase [Candidatus Thermoplasmatota archaeon]